MPNVLKALDPSELKAGAWCGEGGWWKSNSTPIIESINPTTGEVLGRVQTASASDYERIIRSSRQVFEHWRTVPAPKRGEVIRLIADELRANKDALGSLVTLETGKIKPEGDGEVQEM